METPRTDQALVVGNSDGIGLETTRRLLELGWQVVGISRSPSPVWHERYRHLVHDVTAAEYARVLKGVFAEGDFDVVLYCVGIGEGLDPETFAGEARVFDTNLRGAVFTLAEAVPAMLRAGGGHFLALSSIADDGFIADAPSYSASKAGLSSYLKALALGLNKRGVHVTCVRFGFVDTKMAQSRWKPMMISPQRAADVILRCLEDKPIQLTYPKLAGFSMRVMRWAASLWIWMS